MPQVQIQLNNATNRIVQNYILRTVDNRGFALKCPGTDKYNHVALAKKIDWTTRYYGRKADDTLVKKAFAYSDGKIYMGDDVAGTLTQVKGALKKVCKPESVTMQVGGNSRMYIFNGYDVPYYYEGNDVGTFYKSAITYKFAQGVVKDARLWAFERLSSNLYLSEVSNPESTADVINIGNDKDSYIRRIEKLGDTIYIFKTDSIWVLRGSTNATYSVEELIPNVGLLAQQALTPVGSAIVFISQQDKQLYEFTGSVVPKRITGKNTNFDFSDRLDKTKSDDITMTWDTVNDLIRVAYNDITCQETYNNHELIAPIDERNEDGRWKWTTSYGAGVSCYAMWTEQGDHTLVTGRADTGLLMYHNRSSNWDDQPMQCILRTDSAIPQPGFNCQFTDIFLRGTPSTGTITIRYYLDSRITSDGTRETATLSDLGEEETLESISFKVQTRFHNWIPLLTGFNYGEMIAFEIYDETLNKEINLEEIIINYTVRSAVTNDLVG